MPLLTTAVIGGIGAVAKSGLGISQIIGGNKKARGLVRPTFKIQDEYFDNDSLAESRAQSGLSDTSKDFYSSTAERGLTSGIDTTLRGGGTVNNIQNLYDSYLQGERSIAAEDDNRRIQNLKTVMDTNVELAGQKTQEWALNKYEPYKDKMKAATQEKEAGYGNLFGGLSDGMGVASAYATSKFNEDLLENNKGNKESNFAINATPISASPFTEYLSKVPDALKPKMPEGILDSENWLSGYASTLSKYAGSSPWVPQFKGG